MATYVVGAGGIGCCIGYALHNGGEEVTFVERDPAKVAWGRTHGVILDPFSPFPAPVIAFEEWRPAAGDTVFLCVKCFDNSSVLAKLAEKVEIIPVQNGFDGNLDSRTHSHEGIASFVAKCEPGTTRTMITRPGDLHLGSRDGQGGALCFASRLRGPFPVKIVNDIRPIKATKLMYNAAISPLAAAAGLDNGELLTSPAARELFFGLLKENYAILTAANVPLGKVGPFHPDTVSKILRTPMLARLIAKFFVRSLRGTYCSMAGDIGGRTELDNYTGHLLRIATIPAPINRAVYDVVSQLKAPDRAVLDLIRKSIGNGATT